MVSSATSLRHRSRIAAVLATASGACVAWSSTPSETGTTSSTTGWAAWRMAASSAAAVFCSETKPAEAPPRRDRLRGRPLRPGPVSCVNRAAQATAAWPTARPSPSKARARAGPWKLPVEATKPSAATTSGLSAAEASSSSTAAAAAEIAAVSAPWIEATQRRLRGSWSGTAAS